MGDVVVNINYKKLEEVIASMSYGGELQRIFANGNFIFRGHASEKYELVPTALRKENMERFNIIALGNDKADTEFFQILKEYNILRRFFKLCDSKGLFVDDIERIRNTWQGKMDVNTMYRDEEWLPQDLWNIAAYAQHYGLPTRLLDWTHDRFVALYFAIEDYLEGRMTSTESENIVIWAMNINIFINQANLGIPLAFVQPVYHGNMNMTAQQGLFTLWRTRKEIMIKEHDLKVNMEKKVDRRPLDVLLDEYFSAKGEKFVPFMYKITISTRFFEEIYRYLTDMGYDAARIYPGYRGVAKAVGHDRFLVSEGRRISSGVAFVR